MSQETPVRYVAKKRWRSHRVKCAKLVCVRFVELQERTSASIVERQDARSAASSLHLVHVTPAGNWSAKTMESKSTSPRYVTTVGRVTDE